MSKSYITESTALIAVVSTGAIVLNQAFEWGATDQAVGAFAGAAGGVVIPFVLRQIHKAKS
jgi:hypothetical protein